MLIVQRAKDGGNTRRVRRATVNGAQEIIGKKPSRADAPSDVPANAKHFLTFGGFV